MAQNQVKEEAEPVEAPGLAEVALWDRILHAVKARLEEAKERCGPTLSMYYVEEARRTDQIGKTFRAEDGPAAATVQLRERGKKALNEEQIARLGKAKVPMRTIPASLVLNSAHETDQSIMSALQKLAKNPRNGLPSDLIIADNPKVVPDDSALLRILRMEPKEAVRLLPDVADVTIMKTMIEWTEATEMLRKATAGKDPDIIDAIIRAMAGPPADTGPAAVPVATTAAPKTPKPTGRRAEVLQLPSKAAPKRRV